MQGLTNKIDSGDKNIDGTDVFEIEEEEDLIQMNNLK